MVNKVPQTYAMLQGLEEEDAIADSFIDKMEEEGVMIVKQTFGLVSKGFNLQKPRATYTSQNGVFTERVR